MNNKVIKFENKNNKAIFLFKSQNSAKNLSKFRSNRVIKKFNFLISNIRKAVIF